MELNAFYCSAVLSAGAKQGDWSFTLLVLLSEVCRSGALGFSAFKVIGLYFGQASGLGSPGFFVCMTSAS